MPAPTRRLTVALASFTALVVLLLPRGRLMAAELAHYRWQNRVLLLFAATADGSLAEQRRRLDAVQDELRDRDMAVLAVTGSDQMETLMGPAQPATDAPALRRAYGVKVEDGFVALPIGKDGGTKWRATSPADPNEIFALIDTMPMRRNEQRAG